MAFPTTSVLDDFNRANSSTTLGTAWSLLSNFGVGGSDQGIISNTAYNPTSSQYKAMYWNATTFGPDCEAGMTISTRQTNNGDAPAVFLGCKDPGSGTFDGYIFLLDLSANVGLIQRYDNGSAVTLGASFAVTIAAGDKIGLERIGSTLTAYKYTGGSWSSLASRTDSTYSAAGYIAFYLPGDVTDGRVDDFFGGTVASGGVTGSATLTQGADTLSAAGTVSVQGSAAITENADTLSSAGTVLVQGSASLTEGADTLTADGVVGTAPNTGSAAITESADTLSAAGAVAVQGSASITEGADTSTAAGTVAVQGSASLTEGADTLSAAGLLGAGPTNGSAAITESPDTLSAAGTVAIVGVVSITELADVLFATGFNGSAPPIYGRMSVRFAAFAPRVYARASKPGIRARSFAPEIKIREG